MNTQYQKVAVVTGASQGLGASIVDAYRKLGYAVVATSRTITPSGDPGILTVQGDIADPATAERVIAAGVAQFGRIDTLVNNAGIFVAKPFTDYTQDDYAATIGVNLAGFFRITQLAIEQMLAQRRRPHREPDHQPGRSRQLPGSVGAGLADQGRPAVRHQVARDRVRHPRHPRQRGLAGHHQDPDAPRGDPRVPRGPAPGRPGWASRATSPRRSSTWRTPPSSPARSCTWTAA